MSIKFETKGTGTVTEHYRVVGKCDGVAVLERFEYHPWIDGHLILVINPVHWRQVDQSKTTGRLLVVLERRIDGATFTVPVYRSIAQLRARTRVTREPRRLYHDEPEPRHFTSCMPREGL